MVKSNDEWYDPICYSLSHRDLLSTMTGNLPSLLSHGLSVPTLGEKLLGLAASRVRAPGTPQTHLNTGRSDLALGLLLQVVRDHVGESSDKDWRVVQGFGTLQVHTELPSASWSGVQLG